MKEYDAVQDECPRCAVVIGDVGVERIDATRHGRIRRVEIECAECGYEWREVLDPDGRVTIRTDDHELGDFT